jgi:hypothetical protein
VILKNLFSGKFSEKISNFKVEQWADDGNLTTLVMVHLPIDMNDYAHHSLKIFIEP